MLGKLLKREIKSYWLSFGIVFLCMLGMTILISAVSSLPYSSEDAKETIGFIGFQGGQYLLSAAGIAGTILVFVRFYSTMTGDRGYLTWTLPATTSQHIWSKFWGAYIWELAYTLMWMVSFGILCVGIPFIRDEVMSEILLYENGVITDLFSAISDWFEIRYLLPIIIFAVAAFLAIGVRLLYGYMCVAIGQLFGKYRLLGTIICYFGIIFVFNILSFVILIWIIFGEIATNFADNVEGFWAVTIVLSILLLMEIIIGCICYFVTYYIFDKRLNLE